MVRAFGSPRHDALVRFLRESREEAGLTQVQVAKRLGRYQSFITDYERGRKRIDAIELVAICDALGIDPIEALKVIRGVKSRRFRALRVASSRQLTERVVEAERSLCSLSASDSYPS
jgi:transcriptional regulator with XRE-family HTH domain